MVQKIDHNKIADPQHEILDLLRQRWSPRSFSEEAISDEALHRLFEAARWAPSSMNEQPWRFLYARRGTAAYDRIFEHLSAFNQKWVGNAPVLILTAIKEHFDSGKENYHALHDLGLAVGNFTVQAQSMGIALHQMAGVNWQKAQEAFDVPEGYHVVTAIALGYYGTDPEQLPEDLQQSERSARKRNPVESFVGEGRWPELDSK